jgi:hypothetical protein
MTASTIARRLHGDYLQRERLGELEAVLRAAQDRGYRTLTLTAFAEGAATAQPGAEDRVLLLRHDVDTDVGRARRMFELERRLGLVGSWFFRRSTWDVPFMHELAAAGCDVGYHYEELADVIKERGVDTAAGARELLPAARERFRAAVARLRASSGLPLDVFAAHGDFANRVVDVSNTEVLDDAALRAELGVRLEAYDVEEHVAARSSDGVRPRGWRPEDPMAAMGRGERVVAVLLHPRSWGGAPAANARADLVRLREGCAYRLRRARRRP